MRSYEFSCSTTSVYFSTGILKVQNGNKWNVSLITPLHLYFLVRTSSMIFPLSCLRNSFIYNVHVYLVNMQNFIQWWKWIQVCLINLFVSWGSGILHTITIYLNILTVGMHHSFKLLARIFVVVLETHHDLAFVCMLYICQYS